MRKLARNDPCPCGSGRKYKRCCLSNPSPASTLQLALRHGEEARKPLNRAFGGTGRLRFGAGRGKGYFR